MWKKAKSWTKETKESGGKIKKGKWVKNKGK